MKPTLITIFLIVSQFCFTQGEHNVWYFGGYKKLDFNSGLPVYSGNSPMYSTEGCSSVCDSNGNILFFSNGFAVWDKNEILMPNGNNLNGHNSSSQSCQIVKLPGSDSLYYLFTVAAQASPIGLQYSIIDLSLNGGNGNIIPGYKNLTISNGATCEKVIITQHQNNEDYWVITKMYGSNQLRSYKLTENGINLSPVISNCGTLVDNTNEGWQGYIKVSRDRKFLACANRWCTSVDLCQFNSATGEISLIATYVGFNYKTPYGIEFSPNSQLLYVSEMSSNGLGNIYQFDLSSGDPNLIGQSKSLIGYNGEGGALQLGPDYKIYCAKNDAGYLGVINSPNELGAACNYSPQQVQIGISILDYANFGLPDLLIDTIIPYSLPVELVIPTAFTPNGDGINDYWALTNIDSLYTDNIVSIYNRWGNLVFQSEKGQYESNPWKGESNNEMLNSGSYYFIIEDETWSYKLKGLVSIIY